MQLLQKRDTGGLLGKIEGYPKLPPAHAAMLMIGEQPGDREDIEGRPFVGPAGKLLDRCLEEARIDRSEVYITNAMRHFNWETAWEGQAP